MAGLIIEVTPTVDTSAYASGDHLGTVHTLSGAAPGAGLYTVLQSLTIIDKAQQKSALDVFLFD